MVHPVNRRRFVQGIMQSLVALPGVARVAAAQEQDAVIKVEVNLVNVFCTVRGKNNMLIGNLEKSSFQVYEDAKQQEIKYFTRETDVPVTIGMLVDTSQSHERLLDIEKRAADSFFRQVLRKKDEAFLMQFGAEAELLQDSTNSPRLLLDGLNSLRLSVPSGGLHPGPVPTLSSGAGTILYDAVYLAADEKLKGQVGRKAIITITDGVDTGSKISRDKAIEAAQKADCIIYSFYYVDYGAYGPFGGGGGGEGELRRMSQETGGRVFHIDRRYTIEDAFRDLQEELRSQYSIAYTPTNPKKDGTFRKLDIRVAGNKDYKVQARKGYYAIEPVN
jgi:VWFA-related protein